MPLSLGDFEEKIGNFSPDSFKMKSFVVGIASHFFVCFIVPSIYYEPMYMKVLDILYYEETDIK